MAKESQLVFGLFRFDPVNERLWREADEIVLRRKTFEVLCYLLEHQGELVTKEALLDTVWADVSVGDTMPSLCVGELRKALSDAAKSPRFIETVYGRGYRFIARVTKAAAPARRLQTVVLAPLMVGRQEELAQIKGLFAKASEGTRQVVFVSGEAGIGKTTFVGAFLDSIAEEGATRTGRGQCIEQYGAGEPYMPVLEALTRLGLEPDGERLVEILRRLAPTWLAQMPARMTVEERSRLPAETQTVTQQQRMLREIAQALEALSAESPLVLLLEDLHWSDFATLELISAIARRSEPARLLILGTYRPVEMLAGYGLRTMKEELEIHQQCQELRLSLLSKENVADYLGLRFSGDDSQQFGSLAPVIHERTEGNPLFMVNVVDYLAAQGPQLDTSKLETPRNIRQMIERNLERLTAEEQGVLEGASVAGAEFSAATVAAALERRVSEVEACCTRLSRQERFVSVQGMNE